MADLPRSPHRGALRSRTFIGIAAAMALQWMPTLLGYCKIRTSRPKTVNEINAPRGSTVARSFKRRSAATAKTDRRLN
eukprot:scaffold11107_cov115-Isochrysis_galbana.AAC.2